MASANKPSLAGQPNGAFGGAKRKDNGTKTHLASDNSLHEEAEHREHGKTAVLELLDLRKKGSGAVRYCAAPPHTRWRVAFRTAERKDAPSRSGWRTPSAQRRCRGRQQGPGGRSSHLHLHGYIIHALRDRRRCAGVDTVRWPSDTLRSRYSTNRQSQMHGDKAHRPGRGCRGLSSTRRPHHR